MATCVARSISARKMFSRAASLTPTMFTAPRNTTTTMPTITSPGEVFSGSQNTPR